MLFPENSSSPVRPRHVELRDIDVTIPDNNRPPTPHPAKSHQKITVTPSPRNRPPTPPSETSGSPRSSENTVEYSDKCCEAFIITTVCSGLIFISFVAGTAAYNYFYYVE